MKLSFRWYGENNSVSLSYIRQIPGMRLVGSMVYDVKPGDINDDSTSTRRTGKVLAATPMAGSARRRNWRADCCFCSTTRRPALSPASSCLLTAASPPIRGV